LNKGYEGFAVDIWSTGVVLYAMIYGTVPFKAGTMSELHKLIIKGKFRLKESASESVRDLLRRMLEVNPKKRITIPEILCHRWFSDYDPNVSLFTQEEEANIKKEFTSFQRMNRNENRNQMKEGINTVDSDWFIERNIDSSQSELTRNITSKSVILAPFNSIRTYQSNLSEESKDFIQERKILRLGIQVKDADRQYEKNYNCEVDNGVYNNFACDSERKSDSRSELNPFGSSVGSEEESQCAEPVANINSKVQEMLMNSLIPKALVIDKNVVKKVMVFGYSEKYIVNCLKDGVKNYATATYNLLLSN
jgi:serine/threonine protein kinase